ncbi:MAG: hydantoinase B/oxoprolinase family protein [Chromatiales bacterium]|nr:hydantoinase B/oxoprolinase family protein [Chromatiales bacterium]
MSNAKPLNIITMQLIDNYLSSAVDEMMQVVVRTSLSPITREVFDFQCGYCRADGEMLLEGEGTYIHSLIYQNLIENWLRDHGDDTYPGDVMITNDPYSDASHLPDMYIFRPIFVDGILSAWSVGGGHQRDVGGMTPGSCPTNATDIQQEGLRLPPLKLYERGEPNKTLFTILTAASRMPDIVTSDIGAYVGACIVGETRFIELAQEYGRGNLDGYLEELLNYTERMARAEISNLPDGAYSFEDHLDDDGVNADHRVNIKLTITVEGNALTYDFAGTHAQVNSSMNNPIGSTRSAVVTAVRSMMGNDVPRNGGAWRPVTLKVPHGSILNPRSPGPVASRGGTAQRLSDVLLGCQALICPDQMLACSSGVDTLLNIGGITHTGERFILTESCWGGWGGRRHQDGIDFMTPPSHNNSNTPIEVNEQMYPEIVYKSYGFVPDTEGAGRHRGAVAVVREWEYQGGEGATLQLRVDRRSTGPYGIDGGLPGAPLKATVNLGKASERDTGKTTSPLCSGDTVRIQVAGAGGWGEALTRDPESVLQDVRNEFVTRARARNVYGVVIRHDTLSVDRDATIALRASRRATTSLENSPHG